MPGRERLLHEQSARPITTTNGAATTRSRLKTSPSAQVGKGGPVTLPDPNIFAFGPWYGGSPYLGPDATARAVGATPIPPSGTVGNECEAGFFFMWHSHNEREITTNNAFPGGMLMMMGVDPWVYVIDETK